MASTHRDEISRLELLHAAHPDGLVFPHLADAYRRAGRYAQAESVLSEGLRRHSDYSSAHVVLGRLRFDQGDHAAAANAFRRVLELDPQNQVALDYLGRVALERGNLEEALGRFRRLARLKPSDELDATVREIEGRLARRQHGFPQPRSESGNGPGPAESTGSSAPNGRPSGPGAAGGATRLPEPGEVVTETMAELYSRQGLHDRAAAVYRQLLDRAPDDERLRAKLEAAESAGRGPSAGESPAPEVATSAPATSAPARPMPPGDAWARKRPAHPAPAAPRNRPAEPRPPGAGRRSLFGPGGVPARPGPGPDPEPSDTRSPIRDELGALLAWRPRAAPTPGGSRPEEGAREAGLGAGAREPRARPPDEPRSRPPAPERRPVREAVRADAPVRPVTDTGAPAPTLSASDDMDPQARSLIAITDLLVGLLEFRDPFFRGGSSLTRLVAMQVAEQMGLDAPVRVDLALAAVLRDLGRLAMGGRLVTLKSSETAEARRKIERHVDLALHLLEGIDLPDSVRLAVRHHHERWDGAGYPDGLSGEGIPLLARILAVVDSFAAMVSPRSYRLPRKVPEAARELQEAAGSQYDPAVVRALMQVLARPDQQPHLGFVQRPHILLVNPDQPGAVVTAAKLCSAGYLAEVAPDPDTARERLRRVPVAALVVSGEAGEGAAAFVREIRVDPLFASLPVVVVDAADVAFRIRLLESGADVCMPPGTSYAELQGTLGALVRRTLRAGRADSRTGEASREQAPWLALQGDIEDFPLTWLLQVMKYDSRTAAIGIRASNHEGSIYLHEGDAIHAEIRGGINGEDALRRMLQWKKGRFTVQPGARPREQTIKTSIMHLLLTQAVAEDHAAAGIFGAVSAEG